MEEQLVEDKIRVMISEEKVEEKIKEISMQINKALKTAYFLV
jgi:hypoxanthine-guanine phosphoribosyltransferase